MVAKKTGQLKVFVFETYEAGHRLHYVRSVAQAITEIDVDCILTDDVVMVPRLVKQVEFVWSAPTKSVLYFAPALMNAFEQATSYTPSPAASLLSRFCREEKFMEYWTGGSRIELWRNQDPELRTWSDCLGELTGADRAIAS